MTTNRYLLMFTFLIPCFESTVVTELKFVVLRKPTRILKVIIIAWIFQRIALYFSGLHIIVSNPFV